MKGIICTIDNKPLHPDDLKAIKQFLEYRKRRAKIKPDICFFNGRGLPEHTYKRIRTTQAGKVLSECHFCVRCSEFKKQELASPSRDAR